MTDYVPTWLDPADVTAWLRGRGSAAPPDTDTLNRVCVQTEAYVQRCRPDQYVPDPDGDPDPEAGPGTYTPDGEVYQGAVMYAARQTRRRNSTAGTEQLAGGGAPFTPTVDDEINRALRTGRFTVPGVG